MDAVIQDERTQSLVDGFGDEGRRLAQAIGGRLLSTVPAQLQVQSVMLSGRSGIGKSLLLTKLSQQLELQLVKIHLGRVLAAGGQHHGLKQRLDKVTVDTPTVVWFVDVELFRGLYGAVVVEFLQKMAQMPQCLAVMTTRHPEKVVAPIRQLCDDHIRLLPPGNDERLHLLQWFSGERLSESAAAAMVNTTHGKTAAELSAIVAAHFDAQAAGIDDNPSRQAIISLDKAPRISASVSWGDIGGLDSVIVELQESIVWPLRYRDQFRRLGIQPSRGILLHGPPGTGKTMLAKAAASEVSANFIPVAIPDLIKGEVGESEKALALVFETAKRSPSIVFLDEIEAIFGSRESSGEVGKKLITQLFLELDSIPEDANVVILAATNERRLIDASILRPGRLDKEIHIPMPDESSRRDILRRVTHHLQIENADTVFAWAATFAMTGAELKSLVRYACYSAIRRKSKTLTRQDFEAAVHNVQTKVDFFPSQ